MPGLFPVVGRSEAEARAKFEALQDLIDPVVGPGAARRMIGGFDLSGFDPDGPVPELPETEGSKSPPAADVRPRPPRGPDPAPALPAHRRAPAATRRSSARRRRSPTRWRSASEAGGADGFNIMPPTLPGGLDDFIELVLPELRRRGLFRTRVRGPHPARPPRLASAREGPAPVMVPRPRQRAGATIGGEGDWAGAPPRSRARFHP